MSGGEIIGDIAQGVLTSRAVEPDHGEADDGHTHESACLNCGTVLVGKHCHACGQAAHVHKSLGAFFHDFLHGVFHFEGKIWRTLPLLAWNPGKLTREYIDGRRASYVSPIALFLFVVFLAFATISMISGPVHLGGKDGKLEQSLAQGEAEAEKTVHRLEQELAAAKAGKGGDVEEITDQLASERESLAALKSAREGKLPETIAKSDNPADQSIVERINESWRQGRENPDLMLFKFQTKAYKYAWAVIPLSVPMVWLLFPFSRRFGLYDHTVFVTYSVSFMLLLFAALSGLQALNMPWPVLGGLLFYAPVHIYRQTRGTYGLSRFGAWWRTWFLTFFAGLVVVLFLVGLSLAVAAG